MGRLFRIRLNRPELRRNLAREYGHHVSDAEIDQWLIDAGFARRGEDWIVPEEDLGHLQPDEVSEADVIDSEQPEDEPDPPKAPPSALT